jgi:hypothetical protein
MLEVFHRGKLEFPPLDGRFAPCHPHPIGLIYSMPIPYFKKRGDLSPLFLTTIPL